MTGSLSCVGIGMTPVIDMDKSVVLYMDKIKENERCDHAPTWDQVKMPLGRKMTPNLLGRINCSKCGVELLVRWIEK
jgi:hypothetical protein